jgi:hypothetical protein
MWVNNPELVGALRVEARVGAKDDVLEPDWFDDVETVRSLKAVWFGVNVCA